MIKLERRQVNQVMFIAANFVNLAIALIFLFRLWGYPDAEYITGILVAAVIIPVTVGIVSNILDKNGWWSIVLPLFLVIYLLIELLFDYILKISFRDNLLLLPYIITYYLGLMGMIGYNFLTGRKYGFITLTTYFINLAATILTH